MLVTVCIITKNEEKLLGACLESVRAIADEIIVVDTGSIDRTVEIACHFGCRVLHHEWQEDFALARNIGLESAKGKWIFCIDADERLSAPSNLHDLLINTSTDIGGYVIERHDLVRDPKTGKTEVNPIGIVRLFRNHSKIRFQGAVHERPGDAILDAGFQLRLARQFKLTHLVKALSQETLIRKQLRYLGLLEKELIKTPGDAWFLYYRGKTRLYLENQNGALADFEAVEKSNTAAPFLRASACTMKAMALAELEQPQAAIGAINNSLRFVPQQSLAHYVAGDILYQCGEFTKAKEHYAEVRLSLIEEETVGALHGDLYITAEKKSYKLGCCDLAQGSIRSAYEHFRMGLGANSKSAECFYGMSKVLKTMNQAVASDDALMLARRCDPEWCELY